MKNKVIKILIALMFSLLVYIPSCYASGATISTSGSDVTPGGTVNLYIDLSTKSVAYDIKVDVDNADYISESEMIESLPGTNGNTSRFYLLQFASEEERKIYESGTRIANIKYKISENAKEGEKLTINVTGDIAGTSSEERNTMNESVTLNVVKKVEEQKTEEEEKKVNVTYKMIDDTNKEMLVTITSNKELEPVEGWTLSEDKKTLTKTYKENKDEVIILKDLSGNVIENVNVSVKNISKEEKGKEEKGKEEKGKEEENKLIIETNSKPANSEKNVSSLPYTGVKTVAFIIVIALIIAAILYFKAKKLKGIK